MKSPLALIVTAGLAVGGVVAAYNCLLTPEARENMTTTAKRVVSFGRDMADKAAGGGQTTDAQRLSANRAWIEKQWTEAGY